MNPSDPQYQRDSYLLFATGWAGGTAIFAVARLPFGFIVSALLLLLILVTAANSGGFRSTYAQFFSTAVFLGLVGRIAFGFFEGKETLVVVGVMACYAAAMFQLWRRIRVRQGSGNHPDVGAKSRPR